MLVLTLRPGAALILTGPQGQTVAFDGRNLPHQPGTFADVIDPLNGRAVGAILRRTGDLGGGARLMVVLPRNWQVRRSDARSHPDLRIA